MDFNQTIEWYNQNAEKYSNSTHDVKFTETAQTYLADFGENRRILDAGCGDGRDAATLTELGADVIGIDISDGLLAVARERYPDISFKHGSLLALPFRDGYFDGVWSQASLVHLETIEDTKTALSEFHRVLKPAGKLFIYVKEQTSTEKTAVVSDSLSQHDRFFRYYTQAELAEWLKNTGFQIIEMTTELDPHGRKEVSWIKVFARKV